MSSSHGEAEKEARLPVRSYHGAYKKFAGAPEHELIKAYQGGDTHAGGILCEIHTGFIKRMARAYRWTGMEDDDLESYAKIGMIEAARRYDTKHNTKLTTYAGWWIRASIVRAYCTECGPIKLPHRVRSAVRKMRKAGMDIDEAMLNGIVAPTIVDDVKAHARISFVSLQATTRGSGDTQQSVEDTVADDAMAVDEVVAERISSAADAAALKIALNSLPPRSRHIVTEMFLRHEPRTLESVGVDLGITRERVRQLQALALRELREAMDEPGENADALAVPQPKPQYTGPPREAVQLTLTELLEQRQAKPPRPSRVRRKEEAACAC
jgi:RNA polymerase sigma-32 factor